MQVDIMVSEKINVLVNGAQWAWPEAMRTIFDPCEVDLLIVKSPNEAISVIRQRRIHTVILDMDSEKLSGLGTIRIIRSQFPHLPCILLSADAEEKLLSDALGLDVFSVIAKPVDMVILQQQLNRLFVKRYDSEAFAMQ